MVVESITLSSTGGTDHISGGVGQWPKGSSVNGQRGRCQRHKLVLESMRRGVIIIFDDNFSRRVFLNGSRALATGTFRGFCKTSTFSKTLKQFFFSGNTRGSVGVGWGGGGSLLTTRERERRGTARCGRTPWTLGTFAGLSARFKDFYCS